MRSTIAAALAGTLIGLLIASIIFVLVSATLYWYEEEDASGLTATEAEAYAVSYVRHEEDAAVQWIEEEWLPGCEARDRSQDGWLVKCGMTNMNTGRELPQIITYLVGDDGAVAPFP